MRWEEVEVGRRDARMGLGVLTQWLTNEEPPWQKRNLWLVLHGSTS